MADMGEGGGGHDDKKGKKKKKGSPRVDMTPMVDLGFLLITFFMLTTTMSKPQAMELNMPDKTEKPDETQKIKESHSLTVILGEDDKIYWFQGLAKDATIGDNGGITDYSSTGIRKVILDKTKEVGYNYEKKLWNLIIVIKAKDESKYKNIVDILDEMAITGSKRYAIVAFTDEDKAVIAKFDGNGSTEAAAPAPTN
ncbi:MAG: biopolymer transporter ExbD [Bacteroidota bacterium]|nr:biopolymer transporter ExbD [Bacteroidota bacterium]